MCEAAYNRMIAYQFLMGCINDKAIQLRTELQNDYAKGDDDYPTTLTKAVEMISSRINTNRGNSNNQRRDGRGQQ